MKDQQLTPEEQDFAAEHHDIVFKYLRLRRLDLDEYYDVVIFRYLRSVKRWFSEPQLHVHNFEIVAFYAMRSAIGHYQYKRNQQAKRGTVLSLDAVIGGTDTLTLGDTLADNRDFYVRIEYREIIAEHLSRLSPQRRAAIINDVLGYDIPIRGGGVTYAKSVCCARQGSRNLCRRAA